MTPTPGAGLNWPAWIQAAAAVAQAAVAGLLFWVTRTYVRLTRDLVKASNAQVELLRAARSPTHEETRRLFVNRAQRYQQQLIQLPPHEIPSTDRMIREASVWNADELREFADLGAKIGDNTGGMASKIIQHLTWLGDRVRQVQDVRPEVGFDYRKFPWNAWKFHFSEADLALAKLLGGMTT